MIVLRAALLAGVALGLEYTRALAARKPGWQLGVLLFGGLGLALLAAGRRPSDLGLGLRGLPARLLGGLALAAVLLLPAAVRWPEAPMPAPGWAAAAIAISAGEELAFRGALFAALEAAGGPVLAVLGSTALWTAAHALSHPPEFLLAVAGAGLLLGLWRWACRDIVGPLTAHVLADLAL